jgi:hypothetical protein
MLFQICFFMFLDPKIITKKAVKLVYGEICWTKLKV